MTGGPPVDRVPRPLADRRGSYSCEYFYLDPFTIPANSEIPPLALNAAQTDVTVATTTTTSSTTPGLPQTGTSLTGLLWAGLPPSRVRADG